MRQIGTISEKQDAFRFAAYLVTIGIAAHAEQDGDGWVIWVRDENHLRQAMTELDEFRADPGDERYRGVEREADRLIREKIKRNEEARKNVVVMRSRWNVLAAKRRPLTLVFVVVSVIVYIITGGGAESETRNALSFIGTVPTLGGTDNLADILRGQVWRLVTPIFIHFTVMHLVMNMVMLFYLGGQIENRVGTPRYAVMLVILAVASNLGQALVPPEVGGSQYYFGGMSGVVYGLFGYIWVRTTLEPQCGMYLSQFTVIILVGWFFYCIYRQYYPVAGAHGVANWAHGVGLMGGMIIGYLPTAFRRPD